jgi:ABC-type molybdenum transport system ATPase subunit/photorepair protein PhrA
LIGRLKKGDFWHLLGPNGSEKHFASLITGDNTKATDRIYIFWYKERKRRKHLGYKKNIGYFSTAMTDLFQKMIASSKWFYLVLTPLACTPSLNLQKKYSVSLA